MPDDSSYDPAVHLSVGDIAISDSRTQSAIPIRIKQSKTDPFKKGIDLFVGRTSSQLCPVSALLEYLRIQDSGPGPLFQYQEGHALTRARFASEVHSVLGKVGVDQSKYGTHSFGIGAATTAATRGIEDSVLKTLGWWESLAYLQYVHIPRVRLMQYSRQLVN